MMDHEKKLEIALGSIDYSKGHRSAVVSKIRSRLRETMDELSMEDLDAVAGGFLLHEKPDDLD